MQSDVYAGADPGAAVFMQLLPLLIIQTLYAVVTFLMAGKQGKNPWVWSILTIVPVLGMFVFLVFIVTTMLSVLDRLNVLEGKGRA
jgi:hypothetical protein